MRPAPRRKLRYAALAAAVTILAVIAAAVPAGADPKDPDDFIKPVRPSASDHSKPQTHSPQISPRKKSGDCDLTKAQVQQRLARGQTRAMCVTRGVTPPPSRGHIGRSVSGTWLDPFSHTNNIPPWCQADEFILDDWHLRRKEICGYGYFELTVINLQTMQPAFVGIFAWGSYSLSDASVTNIYEDFVVRLESYSGNLTGLGMDSDVTCAAGFGGHCSEWEEDDFDVFQVLYQYEHDASGYWGADTIDPSDQENQIYTDMVVTLTYPGANNTQVEFSNSLYRCDNLMPQPSNPGCIQPWYDPVLEYSQAQLPSYVDHLLSARAEGFPGFQVSEDCPESFNQCGQTLSRLQAGHPGIQQNRDLACGSWVSAPGYSCDEYPMASTYQGAYMCECLDWSAADVIDTQNSYAGTLLGQFYGTNRVIRHDQFWVGIVA